MATPKASIVITTRNRKDDLERALASCLNQTIQVEVVVVDDGSDDGTSEMVKAKFPEVVLYRADVAKGYIVQRNFAARMAKGAILFSLDDDACFSSPCVVEQILDEFGNPAVGAVAIPFIDVCKEPVIVRQAAPAETGDFVISSFIGTAHALRRDLFLQLGGYREQLFHQGEESDYCLRMLHSGYVVKLGRSDAIHHFESPKRDFRRMDLYGRRNNVLFGWHNAPSVILPLYLLATTFNGIRYGLRVRRVEPMIRGLTMGFSCIPQEWSQRNPVSLSAYKMYRDLVKCGSVSMDETISRIAQRQPILGI